ncbi:MAG: hypothetical protein AAFQ63_18150 [Cyanobacteria bacterium J06621_11]
MTAIGGSFINPEQSAPNRYMFGLNRHISFMTDMALEAESKNLRRELFSNTQKTKTMQEKVERLENIKKEILRRQVRQEIGQGASILGTMAPSLGIVSLREEKLKSFQKKPPDYDFLLSWDGKGGKPNALDFYQIKTGGQQSKKAPIGDPEAEKTTAVEDYRKEKNGLRLPKKSRNSRPDYRKTLMEKLTPLEYQAVFFDMVRRLEHDGCCTIVAYIVTVWKFKLVIASSFILAITNALYRLAAR